MKKNINNLSNKEIFNIFSFYNGRDEIYFIEKVKPIIDFLINGVLLTLNIFKNNSIYEDINQEIYLKIIPIINDNNKLYYMNSIKNFLFISIKNAALYYLFTNNKYKILKRRYLDQLKLQQIFEY